MTDKLPIVPPAAMRVRAMTHYAERTLGWPAADVVGTLVPKRGIATIENIAVIAFGRLV
jgi:hypothetical protein